MNHNESELTTLNELESEEPETFAKLMIHLHKKLKLKILGGCCGTDARHIEQLGKASASL